MLAVLALCALAAYERRSLPLSALTGARRGLRDPRQRAARASAARDRRLRRVADRPGFAHGDRRRARGRDGRARRRAVGRAERGAGRLLRDHDRLAGALEGEQPEHARRARRRRLDRRRARAPGRAAVAGACRGPHARGHADESGRVRADAALPRRGRRLLARGAGREGSPRAAGDAHALEPGAAASRTRAEAERRGLRAGRSSPRS